MTTAAQKTYEAGPPGAATRLRIVEAAERLFAENGIKGTSLRSVMAEAGVNIAAINYHFGTKERLMEAVFARTAVPFVEERLRLLEACAAGPGRPPLLEQIIEAFLRPVLKDSHDIGGPNARFSRLRALLVAEAHEFASELIEHYFGESIRRFHQALRAALPRLSEKDLHWRYHFMIGAVIYTLANPNRLQQLTRGASDPSEEALKQFVSMLSTIFRAPNDYGGERAQRVVRTAEARGKQLRAKPGRKLPSLKTVGGRKRPAKREE